MESVTSRVRARAHRRLDTWPPATRLNRVRHLVTAGYRSMSRELEYYPSDQFRQELLDLKHLMRRGFQALAYNGIKGDYAEFGCYGGRTFTLAWGASRLVGYDAHLWAFDSFEGLPPPADPRDAHVGWTEGVMAMSEQDFRAQCRAHGLPDRAYTTVPGFYADSLRPGSPGPRPDRISFAYIDCDLYSSTFEALEFVGDRLCTGAVVAFDDYYCFSEDHPSGERMAASEYFGDHARWRLVPYIQWGWYGMSFMVEPRDALPGPPLSW
jgi:O-methyltransferase